MIMTGNRAGNKRRKHGADAVQGRRRLRPTVSALEGRELLSTLTVSNTSDSGAGSLRAAIVQANADAGGDTIVFSSLFNTPRTIRLTGGPLILSNPAGTTITGPGENLLSISGNNATRVFRVTPGAEVSLSGLTITKGSSHGNGGGIQNNGGTLALDDIVLRGNSARKGGGLYNNGSVTVSDVVFRGNHAQVGGAVFNNGSATLTNVVTRGNTAGAGASVFSTRTATLTQLGLSSRETTGTIINQTFNSTGFPSGWMTLLPGGSVVQSPQTFLTITDKSGNGAGIMAAANGFSPLKVTTTLKAQINSISASPLGNAVIGLVGLSGTQPVGELAAGIDAKGNVFVVAFCAAQGIAPTPVPVGVFANYTGKPVTLTVTIDSTGVQVTAATKTVTKAFTKLTFAKDLSKFSLATAFPSGAIPALVAASQPKQTLGAASFESITVSTA
jgi:hypothetical protein